MPARSTRPDEEPIVFGKQSVRREWREQYATASACLQTLRSLHSYAHAYLIDAELSPTYGGPPV
jgi:hypothetical protein